MSFDEQDTSAGTPAKSSSDFVDEKDIAINADPTRFFSESHKSYVLERHGRLDLDPVPSMDPADPYNWALWKVSYTTSSPMSTQVPWLTGLRC